MSGAATIIITNIPPNRMHAPAPNSGFIAELVGLCNDNIAGLRSDDLRQIQELVVKSEVNWSTVESQFNALGVTRPYVQQS